MLFLSLVAYRRWFCESATGGLLIFYGLVETAPLNGYTHPPNPHDYTYYASAAPVGLVRAPPGPFAYFLIVMAKVVACSYQNFVDGHWPLVALLVSLSGWACEQEQGIRDQK
jgi:hypothetical protein